MLVGVVALSTIGRGGDDAPASAAPSDAASATSAVAQPAASGPGTCAYPSDGSAAKENTPPPAEGVSSEGTVSVTLPTGRPDRPHPRQRPRAVHRRQLRQPRQSGLLRRHHLPPPHHGAGLQVLQCGDPTGTGTGGPGYTIPDEVPTDAGSVAAGAGR